MFFGKGGTKEKAPQLTKQQKDDLEKRNVYLGKLYKESRDYHATLRFMRSFLSNEQVTNVEQRMLLFSAFETIMCLHFDFRRYIRSDEVLCDKDLSLLLSGYRSKVVNVLQGICDNVSNLTVQEAYTRYLDDFKTGLKLSPQDHLSRFQNEDEMSVKKKKKKSKPLVRGMGGSRSCKTPSLMNDYLRVSRVNHSKCCMNNDLETSDFEYDDPNFIMARVKEYHPRLELGVLPSDDDI
ncbi:14-3-3-like protein [Tanacetum coccineum]